jgi:hypothetical protein
MDGVTNGRRRNMRVKWVFRCDTIQGFFRLARVMWEHGEPGKPGGGYSAKFAVALDPRLFRPIASDADSDWRFTLFGIRLHYCRSYGGLFV